MTTMRVMKDGDGSGTEGSTTAEGLSGLLDSFQDGENVLGCQESPNEIAPIIKQTELNSKWLTHLYPCL